MTIPSRSAWVICIFLSARSAAAGQDMEAFAARLPKQRADAVLSAARSLDASVLERDTILEKATEEADSLLLRHDWLSVSGYRSSGADGRVFDPTTGKPFPYESARAEADRLGFAYAKALSSVSSGTVVSPSKKGRTLALARSDCAARSKILLALVLKEEYPGEDAWRDAAGYFAARFEPVPIPAPIIDAWLARPALADKKSRAAVFGALSTLDSRSFPSAALSASESFPAPIREAGKVQALRIDAWCLAVSRFRSGMIPSGTEKVAMDPGFRMFLRGMGESTLTIADFPDCPEIAFAAARSLAWLDSLPPESLEAICADAGFPGVALKARVGKFLAADGSPTVDAKDPPVTQEKFLKAKAAEYALASARAGNSHPAKTGFYQALETACADPVSLSLILRDTFFARFRKELSAMTDAAFEKAAAAAGKTADSSPQALAFRKTIPGKVVFEKLPSEPFPSYAIRFVPDRESLRSVFLPIHSREMEKAFVSAWSSSFDLGSGSYPAIQSALMPRFVIPLDGTPWYIPHSQPNPAPSIVRAETDAGIFDSWLSSVPARYLDRAAELASIRSDIGFLEDVERHASLVHVLLGRGERTR